MNQSKTIDLKNCGSFKKILDQSFEEQNEDYVANNILC